MRQLVPLVAILSAGLLHAQVPLDLDSPFYKTAILEARLGQSEEVEILRAKRAGENLEMTKPDGTILLAARAKVTAIFPKLPSDGFPFTQMDAQKALSLLQTAKSRWPNRPETSAATLAAWAQLAAKPSQLEKVLESQKTREIQEWLAKIQPEEGGKPRPVDLREYFEEGEKLAREGGPQADQVFRQLEKIRNLMAIDLGQIRGKRLPVEWSEVNPLLPVSLTAVLLVMAFWVFGNIANFFTALKTGVIRNSHKGGENRIVINDRGFFYLAYAVLGGGLIYCFLQARPFTELPEISESSAGGVERGLYLSMNTKNRWSSQPKSSLDLESSAVVAALQSLLPAESFRLNQLLTYQGPKITMRDGKILWRQSLHLAFVPIHLDFSLQPSPQPFLMEKPSIQSCRIGSIPIGEFFGDLLWGWLRGVTSEWDQALGLRTGAIWVWNQSDLFHLETPAVAGKKNDKKQEELSPKSKPNFKEAITATELAQIFAQGDGDVYRDRTIQLTGKLKSVSSMRRLGNTVASEITRGALTKTGGAEAVQAVAPSGLEDEPDAFFLETSGDGIDSKFQVKVLVKSPEVYYLDGRGDLYRVGTNPNTDTPIVARQKMVLFRGGRVEGVERSVIEVYGAQPPEEMP